MCHHQMWKSYVNKNISTDRYNKKQVSNEFNNTDEKT